MPDVTLIGGGVSLRNCNEVLTRAGFSLRHALDFDERDRSPVILGEVQGAFNTAREIAKSGRHLLITNPQALPVERLSPLFEARRSAQALFVWSDRRYHPGYRFARGLVEADASWRPRLLRQVTLTTEPPTSSLIRWRTLESFASLQSLIDSVPETASARANDSPLRAALDYLSLHVSFASVEAYVVVGLGELVERRETLIAAPARKAFVDELNPNVPVRVLDEESRRPHGDAARSVSYAQPPREELVQQQCLAFLEATMEHSRAQAEASLWTRALAVLQAAEKSLTEGGAAVPVSIPTDQPRFRLIVGRSFSPSPTPAA